MGQFTTDIRHISGRENIVADAMSKIETIQQGIDYQQLAVSQGSDSELQELLRGNSFLQLKRVQWPDACFSIYCDVSTGAVRPFMTTAFRKTAFNSIHSLAHPGARSTVHLLTQKFVWPSIKADCRSWARACLECQRSKISRHVAAPVGQFSVQSARFEHIHLDIVIMPYAEEYRYCLTMVDSCTRWPEAVPIKDQEAATVARAFYATWVSRFGVPLRITTDQGRQFESHLFRHLNELMGTTHIRTTAYHPAANGMVERFHRQLKAALRCHNEAWTKALPTVLLGIRTALKEDLNSTAAEMVFGQPLRLPGELFGSPTPDTNIEPLIKELREHFQALRPADVRRHGEGKIFVFKELATASHVFVRYDAVKAPLQNPYTGPHRVISRADLHFNVDINGRETTVSISRLKPAFVEAEVEDPPQSHSFHLHAARPHTPESTSSDSTEISTPPTVRHEQPVRTRYGRIIRFPDRFQAGLS